MTATNRTEGHRATRAVRRFRPRVDPVGDARPWPRAELLLALELAGLTAFAFARPVLDSFGRSPETFVARGADAGRVVLFGLLVTVVPLAAVVVVGAAARPLGRRVRWAAHLALLEPGRVVAIACNGRVAATLPLASGPELSGVSGLLLPDALASGRVEVTAYAVAGPVDHPSLAPLEVRDAEDLPR